MCIITEDKIHQMINLPFGLKNATSAFARIMDHVLTGLENVIAYVDDILIFTKSENFDEHIKALRSVFERCRRFNLKLSPKKCTFASAFIRNCYLLFGGCTELITDNALAFTSEFFKSLCNVVH
ncbi:unnamed protein product [Meloidogyne enterolobii]|uniref:Uncharacterized protein n=1 Tax=Meloidogyne enterolobii TaxID=390850 RepID=A0ACB0XX06_MELEN